jgi:hypothetical protein
MKGVGLMLKDNTERINNIFKEMYDLKIEYRVYGKVIVNAVMNIATCEFNNDDAGVKAWTDIRDGYTQTQEMIKVRIKDLYAEALRLKTE